MDNSLWSLSLPGIRHHLARLPAQPRRDQLHEVRERGQVSGPQQPERADQVRGAVGAADQHHDDDLADLAQTPGLAPRLPAL